MGQALYRKYRSKKLAEVVGQEHITRALTRALETGEISHAYLFTGPRGVGKTSIARILAHEVNQFPYDETTTYVDIIEIDAASNRRIDEVRDLRDKVHIVPTRGAYKVYIIDEVHMLTREAFNALLKTLEEPPKHVIFILATTEVHKLPDTIISRTQHYAFHPVAPSQVVAHLQDIADHEGVTIEPAALERIAMQGGGSFRDSISLLDQMRSYGAKVTLQDVEALLGIAPDEAVRALLAQLEAADAAGIIAQLETLRGQGIGAATVASQLSTLVRTQLVEGQLRLEAPVALGLLSALLGVSTSPQPHAALELACLEVALTLRPPEVTPRPPAATKPREIAAPAPVAQAEVPVDAVQVAPKPAAPKQPSSPVAEANDSITSTEDKAAPPTQGKAATTDQAVQAALAAWPDVLAQIKRSYNTLYGVLRMAEPLAGEDALILQFAFPFHQKRVNEAKNKKLIAQAIVDATGNPVQLRCEVTDKPAQPKASPVNPPETGLETISNIFGSAEVLES